MANTRQKFIIDVETNINNLENLKKSMSAVTDETGAVGRNATKIIEYIDDIIAKLKTSGKSMPLGQINKIAEELRTIARYSDKITEAASKPVMSEEERVQLLTEINKQLKKEDDLLSSLIVKQKKLSTTESQFKDQKARELLQRDKFKTGSGVNRRPIVEPNTPNIRKAINDYIGQDTSGFNKAEMNQYTANVAKLNKILDEVNNDWKTQKQLIQSVNVDISKQVTIVNKLKTQLDQVQNTPSSPINPQAQDIGTIGFNTANDMANKFDQVAEGASKAGQSEIALAQATEKANSSFQGLSKTLVKTHLGYQILKRVIRESLRTIQDMDKALTGMTVVTGMSREEAQSYVHTMQNIASSTSTAMTEVANLTTEYLRQGRTIRDALSLAENTAKFAKISGLSTAESIQYITAAINGFNLAANQASHVSDVFANLAATSATSSENLAIALSKVSAQANLAGMSLEYTSALLAKGMETTQEAPESIGTALKTVLARMRELKDYGSTLEDGGDVNKVESALQAAGIALRDVNGQFRNLEDIFNELGPQWDTLNKMQQQAIAQAVAGTRQQSRFVAIMQDWQRTSELAAIAQDSAGASAAQYVQYAKGLEAAMTNLKNAWQKFIESVTSSKIIIDAVHLVTSLLDGINGILEAGGNFTKSIGTVLIAVLTLKETVGKLIEGFKAWADNTNEIKNTLKEQLELNKQIYATTRQSAQGVGTVTEKYNEQLAKIEKIKKTREQAIEDEKKLQEELAKNNEAQMTAEYQRAEDVGGGLVGDPEAAKIIEEENQKIAELKNEQVNLTNQLKVAEDDLAKNSLEVEKQAQQELNDMTGRHIEMLNSEGSIFATMSVEERSQLELQLQQNDALIEQLKLEREILETKMAQTSDEAQKAKYQEQIDKLNLKINKTQLNNNKLMQQATRSLGSQNKVFGTLANKLSRKFGVNLLNIRKTYKGLTNSVYDLFKGNTLNNKSITKMLTLEQTKLANMTEEKDGVAAITKQQEVVAKLKEAQNAAGADGLISTKAALSLGASQEAINKSLLTAEQQQTMEKRTQELIDQGTPALQAKEMAANEILNKQEQENTKEKEKGFFAGLKNAATAMMESAAKIPVVGWVIAAAIAATMLGIGIATAVGNSSASSQDNKKEDTIASRQATAYNLKKDISQNTKYEDEFSTLLNKSVLTAEEQERLSELTDSIQDLDESFAGLEGEALLKALQSKNIDDKANYNMLINSNADMALSMTDLNNSLVARNAIEQKMQASQKQLIETNKDLIEVNNELVKSNVTTNASKITSDVANNIQDVFDDQGLGMAKDFKFGDYLKTIGMDAAIGAAAASVSPWIGGIVGTLGGIANAIVKDVQNSRLRAQQLEDRQAFIEKLNNGIVDFTVSFETTMAKNAEDMKKAGENSSFAENLQAYRDAINDFTTEFGNVAAQSIEKTYSTFSFINDMLSSQDEKIQDETIKTIDKLLELQILTEEAIEKLANLAASMDDDIESYKKAEKLWTEGDWRSYYDRLVKDTKNNITSSSTAQEALNEILKHAKTNSDGTIAYDSKGVIKFRDNGWKDGMSDAHVMEVYNRLKEIIATGHGDESLDVIKAINGAYSTSGTASLTNGFTQFINNLNKKVDEIDLQNLSSDKRAELLYKAMQDSDFMGQVEQFEKNAAEIREKAKQAKSETEKNQLLNKANKLESDAAKWRAEVENTRNEMLGLKGSQELSDLYTKTTSALSKARELAQKSNTDEWSAEDIERRNEIAATLAEKYGVATSKMVDNLAKGDVQAQKYYEEYANIATENALDVIDRSRAAAATLAKNASDEASKTLYNNLLSINESYAEFIKNFNKGENPADLMTIQLENLKNGLTALQNAQDADTIRNKQLQKDQLNNIKYLYETEGGLIDQAYAEFDKALFDSTKNTMKANGKTIKDYITNVNGVIQIDEKWYEHLSDNEKNAVNEYKENLSDRVSEYQDYQQQYQDLSDEMLDDQVDAENELYDAYCDRLDKENEALQEALDKRKEMYEKYFNALEEQEQEEDYETKKARLENAIAGLSASTDAASLQKLKDYQQQLSDLEDERNQELRDARREAVMADLDNMKTAADESLEEQKQNKQTIIDALRTWTNEQLGDLLMKAGGDMSNNERTQYMRDHKKTLANFGESIPSNAKGGLVDYTGPAWVDGTRTNPEAFLSADQTAIFASLANNLSAIVNGSRVYTPALDTSSSVTIESFNISVNGNLDSNNIENTGNDLASAFMEGLRRTGINLNKKA